MLPCSQLTRTAFRRLLRGSWSHLTWLSLEGDNLFNPTLHFWDKGYKSPVPLLQDEKKKKKKPSSVSSTFQKFQCDQIEAETSLEITPFLGFLPFPVQTSSLPDSFLQVALP